MLFINPDQVKIWNGKSTLKCNDTPILCAYDLKEKFSKQKNAMDSFFIIKEVTLVYGYALV